MIAQQRPWSKAPMRRPVSFSTALGWLLLVLLFSPWAAGQEPVSPPAPAAAAEENQRRSPNALAAETSPYLLQHAYNPVHWRPWGPEALAQAKKENKPIFLSVGYSTCYWCHVMERESFEDQGVAEILNEHYIAIKVDREERPEIDEQYMLATQLLRGSGGWPNSVWLTPDGRPWMAGTYFPKDTFKQVLTTLADFWKSDRTAIEKQADEVAQAIRKHAAGKDLVTAPAGEESPKTPRQLLAGVFEELKALYDPGWGGFGKAPKFPPHGELRLLLDEHCRQPNPELLALVAGTLDAMARGGVRDHLGGGFHRYSTDERWLLPHFEKMLYDNAQLLESYARAAAITGSAEYRQAAQDIVSWLDREMTGEQGAFYSALDSESEQEEGKSYVWTKDQVLAELGADDGQWFCEIFGVTAEGNFEEERSGQRTGANVLHLPRPLAEVAKEQELALGELEQRLSGLKAKLLAARQKRTPPHLDDKIIASWNGLMIGALATAGKELKEPSFVRRAERAAQAALELLVIDNQLHRTWRAGQARQPAYLEDYACLARGFLDLHAATQDPRWLSEAQRLADVMLADFQDDENGGFYFTSARHESLLARSKSLFGGGNTPLPAGVAAEVLLRLGGGESTSRYSQAARRSLESMKDFLENYPRSADSLLTALAITEEETAAPQTATSPAVAAAPAQAPPPTPSSLDQFPGQNKPDAALEARPVALKAYISQTEARKGQEVRIAVQLTIDKGWHLYGPNPQADFVIPSSVALASDKVLEKAVVDSPEGMVKKDPVLNEELRIYEQQAWFLITATVADAAPSGDSVLELKVKTQACDEKQCLPPKTVTLKLPLEVTATAAEAPRHPQVFARWNKDESNAEKQDSPR